MILRQINTSRPKCESRMSSLRAEVHHCSRSPAWHMRSCSFRDFRHQSFRVKLVGPENGKHMPTVRKSLDGSSSTQGKSSKSEQTESPVGTERTAGRTAGRTASGWKCIWPGPGQTALNNRSEDPDFHRAAGPSAQWTALLLRTRTIF